MRVLLDENLDRRLARSFDTSFKVVTVADRGWAGKANGALLRAAEEEFDAFVTMDQGMEFEQNLASSRLGIVIIRARSNRRQDVEPTLPEVNRVLRSIRPGELIHVSA